MAPIVQQTDLVALGGSAALSVGLWLVSNALTRMSLARERLVASFAGGVSLAFVLLELFVELAEGASHALHDVVRVGPEPIHTTALLILAGAVATFAAHVHNARHAESWRSYVLALGPQALYGVLVGAALDGEVHESWRSFSVFLLAMVLHLGVTEHRLAAQFPGEHRGPWRAVALGAPLVGALFWIVGAPGHAWLQVLLALVAGATIPSVFREEIPPARDVRIGVLFSGITLFGLLVEVRWWL